MGDINILSESLIEINEVKEESCYQEELSLGTSIKQEHEEHAEEQVCFFPEGAVPSYLKREVKEEQTEEDELLPPARVFLDPKEYSYGEVEQEWEDPLAMCIEKVQVNSTDSDDGECDMGPSVSVLPRLKETAANCDGGCREGTAPPVSKENSSGRSHECCVCHKSFARRYYLLTHLRIHSGEYPYECSICRKSFMLKGTLVRHMRIHSGERPFQCSICEKGFADKNHLERHLRIHSGERPYECSICRKSFSQRDSLATHLRVHSGERPFECPVCQKSFTDRRNLHRHSRIHNVPSAGREAI